jgi:hypothetical protein
MKTFGPETIPVSALHAGMGKTAFVPGEVTLFSKGTDGGSTDPIHHKYALKPKSGMVG